MHDNWVEQAEAASTMQLRMESIHRSLELVQVASLDSVDQAEPMFLVMDKPTQWELKVEDERLDKALRRWANEAGYALRWDADRYVLIAASTVFTGSFEKAVEKALDTPGIKYSEYPLEACVYANEPPLIRITRMGDQADICQ